MRNNKGVQIEISLPASEKTRGSGLVVYGFITMKMIIIHLGSLFRISITLPSCFVPLRAKIDNEREPPGEHPAWRLMILAPSPPLGLAWRIHFSTKPSRSCPLDVH